MSKRNNWRTNQDLLALLVKIANHKRVEVERVANGADGERIVTVAGQRWRCWRDERGDEHATPIVEGGR